MFAGSEYEICGNILAAKRFWNEGKMELNFIKMAAEGRGTAFEGVWGTQNEEMSKQTADWGKTGEKWLPKGFSGHWKTPFVWKAFLEPSKCEKLSRKGGKTVKIPKCYAMFTLMWEKYEKIMKNQWVSLFINFSVRRTPVHGKTYERQEPEGRTLFFKISFSSWMRVYRYAYDWNSGLPVRKWVESIFLHRGGGTPKGWKWNNMDLLSYFSDVPTMKKSVENWMAILYRRGGPFTQSGNLENSFPQ